MKSNAPSIQINTTTLEESPAQLTPDFPYMTGLCDLHQYPGCTFPWHWHTAVEFFYMRKGSITYSLPGGTFTFQQGEGGFINSGILHMTHCEKHLPSLQEEHIFLPQFIGGTQHSVFMEKYLSPITSNTDFELFFFSPEIPEHKKIIDLLSQAYDFYTKKPEGYEFDVRDLITQVWRQFFALTGRLQKKTATHSQNIRLKLMMEFIAAHYSEKLTLSEIAASSFISTRECSRCFKETLGQSPFAYLISYRLYKSCDLLSHTDLSVTEIAAACGFNSSSYFTKLFGQQFSCTPKEYRRLKSSQDAQRPSTDRPPLLQR